MAIEAPALLPVHRLAARHACREPGALAVADAAGDLSYGELELAATALARDLRARGAGLETPVGVCLPRSRALLVALLAVHRAGAVALMLDPSWPPARIAEVRALVEPPLVIGRAAGDDAREVDLAPSRGGLATAAAAGHLDALACLVLTSGSTGAPKPVGVTHRALAHRARTHVAGRALTSADRHSWLTPPGASAMAAELWPVLAAGASLHVPPDEIASSPVDLGDWLVQQGVTVAFAGMPLAELLCTLPWDSRTRLRILATGGDTVRRWAPAALPFDVGVEYGSSEANGVTSAFAPAAGRCTSRSLRGPQRPERPPIGHPWPGVRVLVAGDRLAPAAGVGELWVGSPELARGYAGDPRLTAERFRPDPDGPPGSRLYRTGDLVRRSSQGWLEHHGRVDAQVKVRGERVEPAAVEAVLLDHPEVDDAVVVGREDAAGDRCLAAFVVAPRGPCPDALRAYAARRLPAAMVPAFMIRLAKLPVTASGKVDRAALPAHRVSPPERPRVADRDPIARAVLDIWAEVLGAAPDIGGSFFREGGDSLAAARLTALIRERIGVRIRLRDFAREPTPAALVRRVRELARV